MIKTEQSQHGTRKMGAKAAAGICSLTMLASIGLAESPASITTLTPADDAQRSHVLQLTPSPSATRPAGDAGGLAEDVNGEPEILFSSHDGYLLFQSGPPNGVAGLSNVNGIVDGEWLDRALIDDFILDGNAIVTAVGINGVWFNGTGGDTPLEGLRVRLWSATPDGLPGELLFDDFVPHEAVETGDVYFGRPEIVYIAHLPDFELPGGGSIISIQPVGTLDGFYQLTAASGLDDIFGIEVHVSYPDMDLPPWTPGHVAFDEYHDVVFTVWGEWVTDGTETCEEWCGTQSPFGCWCDELCDEFDDCCEDVCEACEDELEFCDPGIDPYTCEGYCGGPSPGGCWCDDWCDGFDDCCDDVCDECDDNAFCDPGIDPYICEGYCGDMAPGGCWCDDWCDSFGDCCDDVCDECEEDVSFCDPNIDPYDCHGELNGDGVVDGGDLLTLLSNWGDCDDPADCPADLNDDGVVDGGDLLILLSNWGECSVEPAVGACCLPDGSCTDGPITDCPVFHIGVYFFQNQTCDEVECTEFQHVKVPYDGAEHWLISADPADPQLRLFALDADSPAPVIILPIGTDGNVIGDGAELHPGTHLYSSHANVEAFLAFAPLLEPGQIGIIATAAISLADTSSFVDQGCDDMARIIVPDADVAGNYRVTVRAYDNSGENGTRVSSDCSVLARRVVKNRKVDEDDNVTWEVDDDLTQEVIIAPGGHSVLTGRIGDNQRITFVVRCFASAGDCRVTTSVTTPTGAAVVAADTSSFVDRQCDDVVNFIVPFADVQGNYRVTVRAYDDSGENGANVSSDCQVIARRIIETRTVNDDDEVVWEAETKTEIVGAGLHKSLPGRIGPNQRISYTVQCSSGAGDCRVTTSVTTP